MLKIVIYSKVAFPILEYQFDMPSERVKLIYLLDTELVLVNI